MRCALPALLFFVSYLTAAVMAQATARTHELTQSQANRIARLVARCEHIDLSDTHIEFNSMDLTADFIPGYSSFIVIRESTTPGPDTTLRRYAVNRTTGDVWEMTLCTRYDFPQLQRMRGALAGRATTGAAELAAESRALGCPTYRTVPAR